MIKKWKLDNFKSIGKVTELDLAPLTLLAGPNSSGKSTLLQSILLLCQSTSNQDPERPIVLNGSLTLLGDLADVCNFDLDSDEITIGWELAPPPRHAFFQQGSSDPFFEILSNEGLFVYRFEYTSGLIKFDGSGGVPESRTSSRLTFCRLEARDSFQGDEPIFIGLSRSDENLRRTRSEMDFPDLMRTNYGEGAEFIVKLDDESRDEILFNFESARVVGSGVNHFLPKNLLVSYDLATEVLKGLLDFRDGPIRNNTQFVSFKLPKSLNDKLSESSVLGKPVVNLFQVGRAIAQSKSTRANFRTWFEQNAEWVESEVNSEFEGKSSVSTVDLPTLIQDACKYTELFFKHNVRYLGPLRDAPKPVYPLTNRADARDLGLKGENTAAVLHQFRLKKVRFLPPEFVNAPLSIEAGSANDVLGSLGEAVNIWISYLDVAETVHTHDRGKEGHELKVRARGNIKDHDLTHVGVGVSQVLPIVVMGLLASPGSCMLFEQPELHLHPMVQSRLADFFIMLSLMGKQCLVETHSEYIVDRLRFRTAQAEKDKLLDLFKIYFVEKSQGQSRFQEISISQFGAIEHWPTGFFDQSQKETTNILLAATEKLEQIEEE